MFRDQQLFLNQSLSDIVRLISQRRKS